MEESQIMIFYLTLITSFNGKFCLFSGRILKKYDCVNIHTYVYIYAYLYLHVLTHIYTQAYICLLKIT